MELNNYDVVKRMQSRTIGLGEFNFDNLTAPPLSTMLDISDISKLDTIATSVRYSGKPLKKKKAIQEIMKSRGFDPAYLSGTNRLAFKFYENPNIIVKVAFDDKGRLDNPREFFNQNVLKPFVTKIFEVAGDGTVALVERVNPIQTREEYLSVADDAFKMLWLLTKRYILADVGTHYFMNTAVRPGFGVVLCDFPYCYEPDGSKLVCYHQHPVTREICGGLIDYDEGFNALICKKCGAVYRASEIAKILKDKEIITKERGFEFMKCGFIKGNQKVITLNNVEPKDEIIRPETTSIKPTIAREAAVPDKTAVGKNVVVNVRRAVDEEINRKNNILTESGVKVSVVRTSKKNNGKDRRTSNNKRTSNNEKFKAKIDRTPSTNVSSNSQPIRRNSNIKITAIKLDDLNEANFKVSSYDAENGLIFAEANTSGGLVKVHFDAKSLPWDELGAKVEDNTSNNSEIAAELEKAKADLFKQEEINIAANKKISEMQETITNLNNITAEKEAVIKEKISTFEDKMATIEKEKEDYKNTMDSKLTTLEQTLASAKKIKEDLDKKNDRIKELEAQINGASSDQEKIVTNLREQISSRDAEINNLRNELDSIDVAGMEASIKSKDIEIEGLRSDVETYRSQLNSFTSSGVSESQVKELNDQVRSKNEEINNLNNKVMDLQAQLDEMNNRNFTAEITMKDSTIRNLEHVTGSLKEKVERLTIDLEESNRKLKESDNEEMLELLSKENDKLKEDISSKDQEISNLNTSIESKNVEIQELTNKLDIATNAITTSKAINPYNVADIEDKASINILEAELIYTRSLIAGDIDPDTLDIPEQVMTIRSDYEDANGQLVKDYLRDQDGNILAIYTLNDVLIDKIKFEEA